MIDSMGDKMETINERLIKETKHVKIVGMKTSNFGKNLLKKPVIIIISYHYIFLL
jgi:hypothetical protein